MCCQRLNLRKTATEKRQLKKGSRKLDSGKIGQRKMHHGKKGNIYVTADKTATGNFGNGKLGNGI